MSLEPTAAGQGNVTQSTPAGSTGVNTSAPSGTSTPASPAAVSSASSVVTGSASSGGESGTAGLAGSGTQQQTPVASPVRDLARGYGPQYEQLASQFQDDQAFLRHLLLERDRAQQASQLAPFGQLYLQNQNDFQAFMAQKQADAAKQQQQKAGPWWENHWKPPEFDPSWEKMLTRDANGNIVPIPGAPPDLAQKYLNYQQFRQQQADKLMRNPFEYLEPGIKQLAQQIADQAVQKHMGSYQDQVFAQGFAQQNASWLWQSDQAGRTLVNPQTGQPQLSQQGQAFAQYVQKAMSIGINDVRSQQEYAMGMLQRDVAVANYQQAQAAPNGQAVKNQFLQQAAAANQPNSGGSIPPANLNGNQPPQNRTLSLGERLRKNLGEQGITDTVLQQQMQNPAGVR